MTAKSRRELGSRGGGDKKEPADGAILRSLLDHLQGCHVFAKDVQSRFVTTNAYHLQSLGVASLAEVVGKTDFDFFSKEFAQKYYDDEQQVLATGQPLVDQEERMPDSEGRERWFLTTKIPLRDADGRITGIMGISRDITERKQNEEERNLLRTLIDNIPHDVYAKDMAGRFIVANACVARTMRADSADALVGKTDFDFYPESVAIQFRKDEEKVLSTGQPLVGRLEPKKDVNGETLWIVTTKVPLRDTAGRVVGIVGVGINDTKRRLEEQTRLHMEDQLRHTEKMKAIGQLAGGIAHDFNNQLMAIMGSADMIRTWPEADLTEHVDLIMKSAQRAADLTENLLSFARKGRYQSVPVDLHKVIDEVVALLGRTIDRRIRIATRLGAGHAMIDGDPSQLRNALLNIAINARDAIRVEGEIRFTTEAVMLDSSFCRNHPHDLRPGPYILIRIADTGVGMDEETQKHIFEPFFTTKPLGEASGMGLAGVYGTVRDHQGSVTFVSELGRGTEFRLWLPLARAVVRDAENKDVDVPGRGTVHVLIAEDEETVRRTIKAILQALGYQVTLCNDGQDAVDFYRESWRAIDLVIVDMVMPRMGGLEAFLAMRAINPSVRAILCSGYSIEGNAQKILDAGVKTFIQKPFQIAELSRAIAEVLRS